jgi:hypothetical protein
MWAVASIVAVLVISIVSFVVVLTTGTSTSTRIETDALESPGAAPSPATAPPAAAVGQLTALIPPEVTNCEEATANEFFPDAIALVKCDSADGRALVAFSLFATEDASNTAFQGTAQANGFQPDSGDCVNGVPGEESWSGGGGRGRLQCGGEIPVVVWSSKGFPILGLIGPFSEDVTLQELYAIWQGISDYPR